MTRKKTGLNPCFSGGWSRSLCEAYLNGAEAAGLNPCFSGGWSRRTKHGLLWQVERVLILVLVEDGLGVFYIR